MHLPAYVCSGVVRCLQSGNNGSLLIVAYKAQHVASAYLFPLFPLLGGPLFELFLLDSLSCSTFLTRKSISHILSLAMFASLSLGLALMPFVVGKVFDVQVGGTNGELEFSPEALVSPCLGLSFRILIL
jgi:hypothetical protein